MILPSSPSLQASIDYVSQTPSSNTGLKCQTPGASTDDQYLFTRVDYLQFVVKQPSLSDCVDFLHFIEPFFDDEFAFQWDHPSVHGKRYAHTARSVRGMLSAFNPEVSETSQPADLWVSIPGSVLSQLKVSDFQDLCSILHSAGVKVTRFDSALDDYKKLVTPDLVMQALHAGNYSGFRSADPRFPVRRGLPQSLMGFTIYFGSTQSDKRLRFYDKLVESRGQMDCYRWEVQYRSDRAHAAFEGFVHTHTPALYLSSLVTGSVAFVDRSSADRLSRQTLLPWWQHFIDRVGAATKVSLPSPRPTMERTKKWMDRQVQTTLAVLQQVYGSYFDRMIDNHVLEGRKRFTHRHNALIRIAQAERTLGALNVPPDEFPHLRGLRLQDESDWLDHARGVATPEPEPIPSPPPLEPSSPVQLALLVPKGVASYDPYDKLQPLDQ